MIAAVVLPLAAAGRFTPAPVPPTLPAITAGTLETRYAANHRSIVEAEMLTLVLSPLWFLLVYGLLTAATPVVRRLARRGPALAVTAVAVVAAVDVARFGLGWNPGRLGLVNVIVGWLVPYSIGAAWASGAFTRRRTAAALLAFGALATIALVMWCGYPAAMVGVPGARISNLNPPTLAAVTFGLAQCGLALLLRGPLRRLMRRPAVWAPVAMVNLSAISVFLWHQTAMLVTTAVALPVGRLPGLHTAPDHPGWILARLAWLPVLAVVLIVGVVLKDYSSGSSRRAMPGLSRSPTVGP